MVRSVAEYGRTADSTPSAAARIADTTRARSISSRVAGIAARIGSIASTPLLVVLTPQSPWTNPVSHFQYPSYQGASSPCWSISRRRSSPRTVGICRSRATGSAAR